MKPFMRLLSAVGIGLAAGAMAGILLAPEKGTDTRKLLKRKGERLADRLNFKLKQGERLAANVKEDIEDTVNGISQKKHQFV